MTIFRNSVRIASTMLCLTALVIAGCSAGNGFPGGEWKNGQKTFRSEKGVFSYYDFLSHFSGEKPLEEEWTKEGEQLVLRRKYDRQGLEIVRFIPRDEGAKMEIQTDITEKAGRHMTPRSAVIDREFSLE